MHVIIYSRYISQTKTKKEGGEVVETITFKIRKKIFKDAISISKRVLPKQKGTTVMIAKENEALIFSKGEKIETYDYVELIEKTEPFIIKFDPSVVDKWLDKSDRDMEFNISFVTEKQKTKVTLHCLEKNKDVEVEYVKPQDTSFQDIRLKDYKELNDKNGYLETLTEANKSFQKSDRTFSEYAKLTDINMFVFDPHFFSVFMFDETTGIMDVFGSEGIAIHKDAIDVIVKSVKKPKEFKHHLSNESLYFKEGSTVFSLKFSNDIRFPDYRSIKPVQDQSKVTFNVDADQINEILKGFPNSKVNKVILESNTSNNVTIIPDNSEFDTVTFNNEENIPRSVFTNQVLKSFFDGLNGKIQVSYVLYQSKTTKRDKPNYFWIFKANNKSKIIPGIIEASGYSPVNDM